MTTEVIKFRAPDPVLSQEVVDNLGLSYIDDPLRAVSDFLATFGLQMRVLLNDRPYGVEFGMRRLTLNNVNGPNIQVGMEFHIPIPSSYLERLAADPMGPLTQLKWDLELRTTRLRGNPSNKLLFSGTFRYRWNEWLQKPVGQIGALVVSRREVQTISTINLALLSLRRPNGTALLGVVLTLDGIRDVRDFFGQLVTGASLV